MKILQRSLKNAKFESEISLKTFFHQNFSHPLYCNVNTFRSINKTWKAFIVLSQAVNDTSGSAHELQGSLKTHEIVEFRSQNEDIQSVEEEFEGLQDALENRGKESAEGVGELKCLEMIQPPKNVVEDESWEEFYEPMSGQFRTHQRTGKKFQIYKVRCVGEKNAFCIFLGPNFTHPWFVVPQGGQRPMNFILYFYLYIITEF